MPETIPQIDVLWVLVCAAIVTLMQGGFCCLEIGLVRAKNSINVALKKLVDPCVAVATFWLFGFALMYGDSLGGWIGSSRFFFSDTAAQCKNCHRIKDKGGALGPDLSQIGKKYKRHELLESCIDPSKKIEEKFASYLLVTKAGKVLTGILVEKSEKQTVLNVLTGGKGELVRVRAADIEELLPQKKSLMPDRLLRDMTPQQAADLLEFLASLK